ncbi:MAG TPA: hypothetical protein VGY66_34420, partial [Gemmataceae bacterium]|nr:hypothetical protein [Gemmataceae bacterium]
VSCSTPMNIQTDTVGRQVDPPRFFPLVGEAQLHHCHWKCTVYYTEIGQSDDPIPVLMKRPPGTNLDILRRQMPSSLAGLSRPVWIEAARNGP